MTTTEETAPPRSTRSLLKGFLAGAIGGLVGAAAKAAGEAVYPPRTQGQIAPPVVLVNRMAGRSLIDEAAAIMLAQLSTAHGLAARVEGAEALSTTNVFRLETTGVAIVCLVYLDSSGPAHMRYSVRRLRRKLPKAIIILGCWVKDIDPTALEALRDNAKADLVAASLGEALKLCIEATGVSDQSYSVLKQGKSTIAAA